MPFEIHAMLPYSISPSFSAGKQTKNPKSTPTKPIIIAKMIFHPPNFFLWLWFLGWLGLGLV
jgi:hypothetical protein